VPVGGPPGFPGGQFPPGGPPGFGPGPGGGFGVPAPAAPSYHLAVDRRTRALIVRGAPRHLELAAEFVALLDRPEGKPPPEVKTLWAQRLRHADPEAIDAVLTQLDLGVRCIALPNSGAVVLTGAEPALKEARKLIEELDIPAPEDAAPPPPKEVDKKELDGKE
ncbi:MAG TPA: secretin N-terminal domain-containing protein, partial [Gemmataceae bacterium]